MSKLILNCSKAEKTVWAYAAKQQGKTLNEFIITTINTQVKNMQLSEPSWMPFSVRVCDCLIRNGITDKKQLIKLVDSGDNWDWRAINNFSQRCYQEIYEWRTNL